MITLIKLSEYMNIIDVSKEVPLNKPIIILGKEHIITRWYDCYTYNVAVDGLIIEEIITCDKNLTYGMLYNALGVKINNKTLSIGDILYDDNMERYYIIAHIDVYTINLISLHNGNKFSDSIKVDYIDKITFSEMLKLIHDYNIKDFNYVGNVKDVLMVKPC